MTQEQFNARLLLTAERFAQRKDTPENERDFIDAMIAELCDIRDDMAATTLEKSR